MRKMKTVLSTTVLAAMLAAGTQTAFAEQLVDTANMEEHMIGVLVYSITDQQVMAFRDYLEGYVQEVFPDVTFMYSGSVTSQDQAMEFIQNISDAGGEGILSFNSYDLEAEVKLCEENGMYLIRPSATESDEVFDKVKDNPYFLGVIGPGEEMEYEAGADMAEFFTGLDNGNEYFILSGGAFMGNAMHADRTIGILDTLQEAYGVSFEQSSEELARSAEMTHAQAGDLTVCICPGYIDAEMFFLPAKEEYEKDQFSTVLSVIPISDMAPVVSGAELGVIDSYNEFNLQLFADGSLDYVTGKISSAIGPAFAMMYNAVTGYAEDFRDNGEAIRLTQGFWTSDSLDDYVEKYTLSSSIIMNAYNHEDLYKMCKKYNPDATLAELEELTTACSYEDVVARRQ